MQTPAARGALLVLAAVVAAAMAQKDPYWLPGRTAMVHLFEWKWADIAAECENFLGPKGFGGVQVSPPTENLAITQRNRPWWERYQPVSYNLVTRSGDEAAFADMVKRCNDVGVRIYADVILNHMTGTWDGEVGTGGSIPDTAAYSYPDVPYTKDNFHPYCLVNNYQDANNIRDCELVELHDLDQSQEFVRQKLSEYLNHLVELGVAGFRVDSAKHMTPSELKLIYDAVSDLNTDFGFPEGSRPFIFQEVIDFGNEAVSESEYTDMGRVIEFRYSSEIGRGFRQNNPLKWFYNFGEAWAMESDENVVVFVDNHDNQRGHGAGGDQILTYKVPRQYKMAVAFMLAWPFGAPRLMSSFAFTDTEAGPPMDENQNTISPTFNEDGSCDENWVCEHRWRPIYNMLTFRIATEGTNATNWWDNDNNQIAFCREEKGFIVINDENVDLQETLTTCLPAGDYCDVISGEPTDSGCSGKTITVNSDGTATFEILTTDEEGTIAIHVNAMSGSGGLTTAAPTGSTSDSGHTTDPCGCESTTEVTTTTTTENPCR
ncbi:alpha-amylase 1-like [Schistocerca nitens]|uniref:alpha-amylase 1-like n=1 Tax=Schistocerca nitens TaxID=7011 RepID=UPI00211977CB|nr:alpha-amylase 1-like [Schistocerca nitens]